MPRIRTLKPEILDDDRTATLPDGAWRLFVSLILLADDHGNVRGNPHWLTAKVFWAVADEARTQDHTAALAQSGLVSEYIVRGQRYLHIEGWDKHQRVDNAGKPLVPTPEEADSIAPNPGPCRRENLTDITDSSVQLTQGEQSLERIEETALAEFRREPPRTAAGPRPRPRTPTTTNDRRALPDKPARSAAPSAMSDEWEPDQKQVEALATKYDVTPDVIRAQVPEFRWYWLSGKGAGKRKSPRGWAQTFANRIDSQAQRELLYVRKGQHVEAPVQRKSLADVMREQGLS